ncbi:beta-ketoacyl synthase N-terminal-like domain-containing protein [Chryseobacterium sp.]|uniref:beta-ketoacyl synthase N-terminal-like domain-containing protein n=1 Tax=Chryseobacterium sp. TaxID=1871047 RepID=UPI0038900B79
MIPVYINSVACISSQDTLRKDFIQHFNVENNISLLSAKEPNYKDYISSAMSRRMSKTVKMSSVASKYALEEAQIENPDAIIIGTGIGCSQDSEKFLNNVIQNNEEFLTPTFFIQSTHNTVSGQIALALQCHAYNFTYVNSSSSLEFSFLDAKLQIEDKEAENILVGSTDEQANRTMELFQLNNTIRTPENLPLSILDSKTKGVIWGEGASFFVVGKNKTENSYAQLSDIKIINALEKEETTSFISEFLSKNNLQSHDIDVVILGYSGDAPSDEYYNQASTLFSNSSQLYTKHLSGEYNTSSGFSIFMACHILKDQAIPEIMKINEVKKEQIKNVLLYNHLFGRDHSLVLLKQV